MNGTLIININSDKGISDEKDMSSEIPVTPPSIK
jgi:hypothetical protein